MDGSCIGKERQMKEKVTAKLKEEKNGKETHGEEKKKSVGNKGH